MKRKDFESRFTALKDEAQSWMSTWKDISTYECPTRGFFDGQTPNQGKSLDHKKVLDGTAHRALRVLAAGFASGLCSPSRPWFRLGLADANLMQIQAVKEWLETVQQRMMAIFSKSNIYGVLYSMFEELGAFGTAACAVLEDFADIIRGRSFTIGEYYLGQGPDHRINSFAREYSMTVGQLVKEFGEEKVSRRVRDLYKRGTVDTWFKVRHLIEPNDERVPDLPDAKNMPYRSLYWEVGGDGDDFLRVSGFEEFPILTARWHPNTTSDIYGRGAPGWLALGDAKMIQKKVFKGLVALDKSIDPPTQGDASVDGQVNGQPGGYTRTSSMAPNAGARALYQIQPDIGAMDQSIERTKADIKETFYADLFLLLDQIKSGGRTVVEVTERVTEKLRQLGPVLESVESELLDYLIERTFKMMLRLQLIPPPPAECQGMEMEVTYISPLAAAQKMVATQALKEHANFVAGLATVDEEVRDTLDFDEMARENADALGVSPKVNRSKEAVLQLRQGRAQAQKAAQAGQAMALMADKAKVLSETRLGQGSVLDQLANGMQGQDGLSSGAAPAQ